jgi:hypothetical protein
MHKPTEKEEKRKKDLIHLGLFIDDGRAFVVAEMVAC